MDKLKAAAIVAIAAAAAAGIALAQAPAPTKLAPVETPPGKVAAVNNGDTNLAQQVVNQAIKDVANLRGRLGAFQKNTLGSTINSLNVALENVASSESAIRDTDFATETSNLTRSQILVQSATSVLSQANQSPQAVLKLLG